MERYWLNVNVCHSSSACGNCTFYCYYSLKWLKYTCLSKTITFRIKILLRTHETLMLGRCKNALYRFQHRLFRLSSNQVGSCWLRFFQFNHSTVFTLRWFFTTHLLNCCSFWFRCMTRTFPVKPFPESLRVPPAQWEVFGTTCSV